MKVSEIKRKYKNKWVLAEVVKADKLHKPLEMKVIATSSDRDEVYDKISESPRNKMLTTIYTGKTTGTFVFYVNTSV